MNTFQSLENNKIKGIAVKLSNLIKNGIYLQELLVFNIQIVIDAEHERLDHFIQENNLMNYDNIICTIQVRRKDAYSQLSYFNKIGMRVILVSGHKSYLNQDEIITDPVSKFCKMINSYQNIMYLGIGAILKSKIELKLNYEIDTNKILELLGYQKYNGSVVWTYYSDTNLSDEGINYLKRRGSNSSKYIIDNIINLERLLIKNSVLLFIDISTKGNYFQILRSISNMNQIILPRKC